MPSSLHRSAADLRPAPLRPATPPTAAERVHSLELALVVLAGLNLCFLPWAFGGVDAWSQIISAGLALSAAIIAVLPRRSEQSFVTESAFCFGMWPRLRRFPILWAGLILFAYLGVQALNPAFAYQHEGTDWWLVRLDHINWLPAGMKTPFANMNTWRSMIIWGSCWLTVCALWTGITRRRSIVWLLTALSVNAFIFASFGIVQRASGTDKIYWMRPVGFPYFLAAIIYKNHAVAFFGLLATVTMGLTIRAFWRSRRRGGRSNPGVMFLFFTFILMLAVGLSFSASGLVLFGAVFLLVAPVTLHRYVKSFPHAKSRFPVLLTAGLLLFLAAGLGAASNRGDLQYKMRVMINGAASHSLRTRLLAARRGWQMFTDRWALGWGAGCFQYGFTKYQHQEPELTRAGQFQLRWEHVHNDWLECLIELGVIGSLPVVFMIAYWFREIVRLRLWRKPAIYPIVCGLGAVLLYGFFDFPFQNPAVAATACALLPLITRWGELENGAAFQFDH